MKVYPLNERKINHLLVALKASGFSPKSKDKGGRTTINKVFLERVEAFIGSTAGRPTRTVINAFRTIAPVSFWKVPKGQSFVDKNVKKAVTIFLAKVLKTKACVDALKIAGLHSEESEKIIKKVKKKITVLRLTTKRSETRTVVEALPGFYPELLSSEIAISRENKASASF